MIGSSYKTIEYLDFMESPPITSIPISWGQISLTQQWKTTQDVKALLFNGDSSVASYLENLAKYDKPKFKEELLHLILIFYVGEMSKLDFLVKTGIADMTKGNFGDLESQGFMFPEGKSTDWNDDEINEYLSEMGFDEFIGVPDKDLPGEGLDGDC